MTQTELGLLPSGHLHAFPKEAAGDTGRETGPDNIDRAFAKGIADGLIALAARDETGDLPPDLSYWRAFACRYLARRCQMTSADPGRPEPVAALDERQTAELLEGVPPMRGAEYLTPTVLQETWAWLDDQVCDRIRQAGGLAHFLARRAPRWHQVGRVCFHLAENRQDPEYPFAFLATYVPEPSRHGRDRTRHQPLGRALQEYAGARNRQALIHLLSPVQRAAEASELIRELVDSGDIYHPLAWTPPEAHAFLREAPLYEQCGVVVRLPDWWKKRPRPQVRITLGGKRQKALGADALLDFRLDTVLGDEVLDEGALQALLAQRENLVFLKGQWVELDRERLSATLEHWRKVAARARDDGLSFIEGMRLLAGAPADLEPSGEAEQERRWAYVQPGPWLKSLLGELRDPERAAGVDPGSALRAELRPYQRAGLNWLWLLSSLGLGACLADDMGLGKTIQVIALLLVLKKRRNRTPSLLVLPASLLANWKAELERFAPTLRCLYLHPSQMDRSRLAALAEENELTGIDLVLTTYGMVPRLPWLKEHEWRLLILDEAQAIKNPATRQTRAVKQLRATARIALTGTPIENRLDDLWSLFDFLCPGLLGSATRFRRFVKSLSADGGDQYAPLRRLVRPYILRRLKTDKAIICDLPEKAELRAWCGLSKAQATLYRKEVEQLTEALQRVDGIQRRGLVLATLMRFKQICNHPSQLLGDGRYDPGASGKFARLAELCEEIAERQEKMLLFTQFRELTEPLAGYLSGLFGRPGLVLHGGTPIRQRKRLVDDFQREDGPPFFVLSLRAGGTGLNLTEAAHVVHFDRWWNPAVENQATDRAFRIGQKKNVLVHKFVCQGTVEEKIDALIEEKTALASELLEEGAEALLTEMDDEQLLELVSLEIDKVQV